MIKYYILFTVLLFLVLFVLFIIFKNVFRKTIKEEDKTSAIKPTSNSGLDKGETIISNILNDFSNRYYSFVYNNYTFMDNKGYSTNIDHILLTKSGLFIIETKSNIGSIYGNDSFEIWEAKIKGRKTNKMFKNPVIQNRNHIKHLVYMIGKCPIKIYSMIVFPFADSISNIVSGYVFNLESFKVFINNKLKETIYSSQIINNINEKLTNIKDKYGISIEKHRENIRSDFKNNKTMKKV